MWTILLAVVVSVLTIFPVKDVDAQPAWQAQWEQTTGAAEREGSVVIYGDNTVEPLFLEVFQKKFPKINVNIVSASGSDLAKRLLTERRAGKYLGDVFIPGGTTGPVSMLSAKPFDPLPPLLILPEVVDPTKWWQGKHHYVDPEDRYVFLVGGSASSGGIFYNTQLVKPNQIRSYWDIADPKWKGRIVAMDPLAPGPGIQTIVFFYHSPELGPEFVKTLYANTGLTLARSDEQLIDWVAVGKFALGFFPRASSLARAEQTGLPVREFSPDHFKEGGFVTPSGLTVSVLNRAPHPNAAKIVINWFLSREGQARWLEYIAKTGSAHDSTREDIPRDKSVRGKREPGAKYFNTQTYELISNRQPIMDLIKKSLEDSKRQ
jgi:iron(III) transport system substrate-binding protein